MWLTALEDVVGDWHFFCRLLLGSFKELKNKLEKYGFGPSLDCIKWLPVWKCFV